MATNELSKKLENRVKLNEELDKEGSAKKHMREYEDPLEKYAHPYPEFSEFSRGQVKRFEEIFKRFDEDKDNCLNVDELKKMHEKCGEPLTHLQIKAQIKEADEDEDGKLNMREFLLMLRKSMLGDMPNGTELAKMVQENRDRDAPEIDVKEKGVGSSAKYFEAQARKTQDEEKYKQECLAEQRKDHERKRKEKEAQKAEEEKKAAFKARAAAFENK